MKDIVVLHDDEADGNSITSIMDAFAESVLI